MSDSSGVEALQKELRQFARERDWEQFHTPKNLVMALAGEVGELADIFQWLTPEESSSISEPDRRTALERELADVFQYLLRLADVLDVDLERATRETIDRNRDRFPVITGPVETADDAPDIDALAAALSDPNGADRPDEFPSDRLAASSPGMYSWWVSEDGRLLLSDWLDSKLPPLIYAGQAGATRWPSGSRSSATLHSRILRNHIHGNARSSTFRKTISAVLVGPLDLLVGDDGKLVPESRHRVSEWMSRYLSVKIAPFDDRDCLRSIESQVLARLNPPLNIEGLPLTDLRRRIKQLRQDLRTR